MQDFVGDLERWAFSSLMYTHSLERVHGEEENKLYILCFLSTLLQLLSSFVLRVLTTCVDCSLEYSSPSKGSLLSPLSFSNLYSPQRVSTVIHSMAKQGTLVPSGILS